MFFLVGCLLQFILPGIICYRRKKPMSAAGVNLWAFLCTTAGYVAAAVIAFALLESGLYTPMALDAAVGPGFLVTFFIIRYVFKDKFYTAPVKK